MTTPRAKSRNSARTTATTRAAAAWTDDSGAATYKLDTYREEAGATPFILDTGKGQIVIPPPTGETVITLGETSIYDVRRLMQLICGETFDEVWQAIRNEPGSVLIGLMRDLGQHFMIAQIRTAPGGPGASPLS